MKQLRACLSLAFAAAILVVPARSCGPDFPEAIFVLPNGPGGSYALFAAGRLGVPQPGYRTRSLVIAYDYLTHRPLSPSEQQQAADVDRRFIDGWTYEDSAKKTDPPTGIALWIAARTALGPVDKYVPGDTLDTSLTANYSQIPNCLDDAFATATRTLSVRSAAYGKQDPAVIEWVRGQDAVFSNCGDGKPQPHYGPGAAPPAPHPPAAVPANAPLWLQQDRKYQLAAANFYSARYDDAITQFRAIAADAASPWSPISRYLVARAIIRKATMADSQISSPDPNTTQQADAQAALHSALGPAQHELLTMQNDPHMASLRHAVDSLLDFVNLRLQPDAQAAVLADRLHGPATDRFGQSLIDLTYLRTNPTEPSDPPAPNTPDPGANDMLDWINDISILDQTPPDPNRDPGDPAGIKASDRKNASADILEHWHANHSSAWLLAAIMFAKPTDGAAADLVLAAKNIPRDDRGYVAITYHRLRLTIDYPATRPALLALLADLEKHETVSTLNLFTGLNAKSAPTLETWLATAGRLPAGVDFDGESQNQDFDPTAPKADDSQPDDSPTEDVCGTKIKPNSTKLFDLDAADAFNRDMPLSLLATAATISTLPANLQFQVAQSAWARAVLLDQPAIAHRMTPILIHCRAAWKPVLDVYDASTSPEDRQANGLLALMRFASTEPSVRYGEERRNAFASYDEFRQNWWCTTVPAAGDTVDTFLTKRDESQTDDYAGIPDSKKATAPPAPLFLTPSDIAKAHAEIAALEKIPNASTYFATQALAWMKLHPKDPRTPDLLGEADRVVRNSCRIDPPYDSKTGRTLPTNDMRHTANLAHALFDALHRNYPQSPWTLRYKSWE